MIKPAEDTPLSALAMAALAEKAGIPAGYALYWVINYVICQQLKSELKGCK